MTLQRKVYLCTYLYIHICCFEYAETSLFTVRTRVYIASANALDVLDCHLRLLFYRILLCNFYRTAACLRKSKLQHLKSHFFCTYLWRHDFDFLEARCLHHYCYRVITGQDFGRTYFLPTSNCTILRCFERIYS